MTPDTYRETINLISHYEQVIHKQNEVIKKLTSENEEKENMINSLLRERN